MLIATCRTAALTALTALVLATPGAVAAAPGPPERSGRSSVDRIDLPDGWQPEGITTDGSRLYVGSLADGRLLAADPRTGRTRVLPRSGADGAAVGVDHDDRRDLLWVAGGAAGEIRVHHATDGRLLRTYSLPPSAAGRFVNDLVVTRDAVYATDSRSSELAVIPLDDRRLPPSGEADLLPLSGDFQLVQGFNLNGIVALRDWLLAVQSATGTLYRIDPTSGETRAVDLQGYSLLNGDGLEPGDGVLYVVRNRDNLIAALSLSRDLTSGQLEEELTSADVDVPTTAALTPDGLYAVNARFGTPPTPETDYWATRVDVDD